MVCFRCGSDNSNVTLGPGRSYYCDGCYEFTSESFSVKWELRELEQLERSLQQKKQGLLARLEKMSQLSQPESGPNVQTMWVYRIMSFDGLCLRVVSIEANDESPFSCSNQIRAAECAGLEDVDGYDCCSAFRRREEYAGSYEVKVSR